MTRHNVEADFDLIDEKSLRIKFVVDDPLLRTEPDSIRVYSDELKRWITLDPRTQLEEVNDVADSWPPSAFPILIHKAERNDEMLIWYFCHNGTVAKLHTLLFSTYKYAKALHKALHKATDESYSLTLPDLRKRRNYVIGILTTTRPVLRSDGMII